MKPQLFGLFPFIAFVFALQHRPLQADPSPLADFSTEWNDPRFTKCNTAAGTAYLSKEEKEVIYILNLVRTDPKLFANTVVQKFPESKGRFHLKTIPEYQSLLDTLKKIKPLHCFTRIHFAMKVQNAMPFLPVKLPMWDMKERLMNVKRRSITRVNVVNTVIKIHCQY